MVIAHTGVSVANCANFVFTAFANSMTARGNYVIALAKVALTYGANIVFTKLAHTVSARAHFVIAYTKITAASITRAMVSAFTALMPAI